MSNGQQQVQSQGFDLDQLNLDTTSENWDNRNPDSSYTPEHDQRNLGNTAVNSSTNSRESLANNTMSSTAETSVQLSDVQSELGQIVPTMPPGYDNSTLNSADSTDATGTTNAATESGRAEYSFARDHVMSGEHLKRDAVAELIDSERKLSDDGDAATFYDTILNDRDQFQGKKVA